MSPDSRFVADGAVGQRVIGLELARRLARDWLGYEFGLVGLTKVLASNAADLINGADLVVDGGYTIR